MKLDWKIDHEHQLVEARLPPWTVRPGHVIKGALIWIEARPNYCDRGRYLAHCDAPLDSQEGWPRYYFDLETAKKEIEAWCDGRAELK